MDQKKYSGFVKLARAIHTFVAFFFFSLFATIANAQYIQTHQKIIDWSMEILGADESSPFQKEINQFLGTKSEINSRLYRDLLKDGVRDADRLANGIESVGKDFGGLAAVAYNNGVGVIDDECDETFDWCWDLTQGCDTDQQIISTECYEMADWPIGDHGYDPDTGRGHNYYWLKYYQTLRGSDPQSNIDPNAPFNIDDNVALYISDLKTYKIQEYQNLLGIILALYDDVSTTSEAEVRYEELLKTSNGAFMAQNFYDRAISEWEQSNPGNAMFNLGIALHMIQDMTVPYHADPDQDIYLGVRYDTGHHQQYEAEVWDIARLDQFSPDGVSISSSCSDPASCPTILLHDNAVVAKQNLGDSSLQSIQNLLAAGVSSSAELLTVFFQTVSSDLEDDSLADAEYFFDTDPGEGNGNPLPSEDGLFNEAIESIDADISVSGLHSGPHYLYIRMRNEEGVWGIPNRHLFVVTNDNTITAAEYFFDTDPGEGNGLSLDTDNGEITTHIEAGDLQEGLHRIFIRMKDAEETWGPARQHTFEVTGWNGMSRISRAEFFINVDPGEGSGMAMAPLDGMFNESEEWFSSYHMTSNLVEGEHTVYFRAQDSQGVWTLPAPYKSFVVEPFDGEIGDLSGDGSVTLIDVIIALQVISGDQPSQLRSDYVSSGVDVDGWKAGMTEAIYVLRELVE